MTHTSARFGLVRHTIQVIQTHRDHQPQKDQLRFCRPTQTGSSEHALPTALVI